MASRRENPGAEDSKALVDCNACEQERLVVLGRVMTLQPAAEQAKDVWTLPLLSMTFTTSTTHIS